MSDEILRVEGLVKYYPILKGILFRRTISTIKAVDGISFSIGRGETFGLAGESGCGKTTTGRCIMGLAQPTSGEIQFNGKSILNLPPSELKKTKRHVQIIFQDPFSSLDPRMRVGNIIGEPLIVHGVASKHEVRKKVLEALSLVGLDTNCYYRFPHEFSGGQRQRIGIARALILKPQLVIADEPVSALDVSIQAQILNLIKELKQKFQLTYLFIAHNLNVLYQMSDRIGVMYLGKLLEMGPMEAIYEKPMHPYTQNLMAAIPSLNPNEEKVRKPLQGDVPKAIGIPEGCRYRSRCTNTKEICYRREPELIEVGKEHFVACFRN